MATTDKAPDMEIDSQVDDFDAEEAPPKKAPPKPKKNNAAPQARSKINFLLVLIALAAVGGAYYEYQLAEGLKTKLASAESQSSQAQSELSTLREQSAATSTKLNELSKTIFPVTVVYRPARTGGIAAFFKNNAPEAMLVSVLLENPATNRRREISMSIPANAVQEIGDLAGWVFTPGQHILVTHAHFGSIDYVVPTNVQ